MVLFLHRLGWFVFLVLLQVLVLNHVHILGYATPMLYIYYILILNAELRVNRCCCRHSLLDFALIYLVILLA